VLNLVHLSPSVLCRCAEEEQDRIASEHNFRPVFDDTFIDIMCVGNVRDGECT
jgi:hypothetical protein